MGHIFLDWHPAIQLCMNVSLRWIIIYFSEAVVPFPVAAHWGVSAPWSHHGWAMSKEHWSLSQMQTRCFSHHPGITSRFALGKEALSISQKTSSERGLMVGLKGSAHGVASWWFSVECLKEENHWLIESNRDSSWLKGVTWFWESQSYVGGLNKKLYKKKT